MRTNVVLPVWVPPQRGEACCWTISTAAVALHVGGS